MVSAGILVIIYISFISLGLPDALLGSAWPAMYSGIGVPSEYAGIVSMLIAGGTVVSSMFSARTVKRFGTGVVATASVLMTACALLGFSMATSFWMLCLCAVPLGLGAGSVDAALNNFVALRYKARHMSWLHCFWGIGATLGPLVMSYYLVSGIWEMGYSSISMIQFSLVGILLLTLPLWRIAEGGASGINTNVEALSLKKMLALPGAKHAISVFVCYSAIEATTGLWSSSFLVFVKGVSTETAAKWVALYYLGITLGRFMSGFATLWLNNRQMIRLGMLLLGLGVLILLLPFGSMSLPGLLFIGLGCAPIFPSMLHETPVNFGRENSQSAMGVQMAGSYVGATFMPLVFGAVAAEIGYEALPITLLVLLGLMAFMNECLRLHAGKVNK